PNQTMNRSGGMPRLCESADLSASTTGKKIGRNTRMIAGHSKGQPSRNRRMTTKVSMTIGGTGREVMAAGTPAAVRKRANTAPKMLDVTASNSTMLEVRVALTTA